MHKLNEKGCGPGPKRVLYDYEILEGQQMFKIALIAVNEHCEKREECLKEYITKKIASYAGYEVIDFTDLSIDEMVELAKEEADRTIIVFDAVRIKKQYKFN